MDTEELCELQPDPTQQASDQAPSSFLLVVTWPMALRDRRSAACHHVVILSHPRSLSEKEKTSSNFPASSLPWCTTPIEADSSLGPDSHHPIISLSGIPSAVMVLRILHPIRASTLCAANPLARIAEPTIAL